MASGGLPGGLDQDLDQDLDFADLFLYNAPDFPAGPEQAGPPAPYPPGLVVDCPSTYHPPSAPVALGFPLRTSTVPAPSPRIEITPSGESLTSHGLYKGPGPGAPSEYRDCASPASSNSSTGWPTETYSPQGSPCPSPSTRAGCGRSALELCPGLRAVHTSCSSLVESVHYGAPDDAFLLPHRPGVALSRQHQRSRSLSPQGKRSYDPPHPCPTPVKQRSRSPSPVPSKSEQQGYLHQSHPTAPTLREVLSAANATATPEAPHAPLRPVPGLDCAFAEGYNWALESGRTVKPETLYAVPAVWSPLPSHHGAFSVSMMPPLSLELPSELGQYKLQILQHPKTYHRAHYETEGSRGAVKTSSGGHPEVQLSGYHGPSALSLQVFIGTADERLLKPHSFYRVQRITGKTVTTPSVERSLHGTRVLEISLEPSNNMRALIDCVGILKLRNADIELRNGETDIGRKNTRVRLVFRVHVPAPGGQMVSLQVCSQPIECSQRAQETPSVERRDLDRCSVLGGQQMVLIGLNFTSDSRVVFTERSPEGEQIWEAEANVDRDKAQSNMLFVEVPPYRRQRIFCPVTVGFYVINGKKSMSQLQRFSYTPVLSVKAEPVDDYQVNYGYPEPPGVTALPLKAIYHPGFESDSSLQATQYPHLHTVDPRLHKLLSDPADLHLYQHRSCPSLFQDQRLPQNTPETLQGTEREHGHLSPHEALPSWRCSPVCGAAPKLTRAGPSDWAEGERGERERGERERGTVKQENMGCAYLEDVNDIIRRDLKDHNVE